MSLSEHHRSGDSRNFDPDKDYGGWVLIYRSLIEHEFWLGERFTKGQAWVDLIVRASHKDHNSVAGNVVTPVKCGQVLTSQMKLAERWMWNRETVVRFLRLLEILKMASIETSNRTNTGYTMITLLNYGRLQRKLMGDPALDPALDPAVSQQSASSGQALSKKEAEAEATSFPSPSARTTLLPDDTDALEAEAVEVPRVGSARPAGAARVVAAAAAAPDLAATAAPPPAATGRPGHLKVVRPEPEEFVAFYEAYTRKVARTDALKAWMKLKPDAALVTQIMAALEAQKAPAPKPGNTLAPTDGKGYIPYPASWLTGKRWTDEIIPASPAEGSTPSPARPLLAEFGRLFEAKVTFAYVGNTDRDLKILEELLAQRNGRGEMAFPPATLQRLMKGFFKYPPQLVRDRDRFDIPTFKTVFPELTRMLSKGDI